MAPDLRVRARTPLESIPSQTSYPASLAESTTHFWSTPYVNVYNHGEIWHVLLHLLKLFWVKKNAIFFFQLMNYTSWISAQHDLKTTTIYCDRKRGLSTQLSIRKLKSRQEHVFLFVWNLLHACSNTHKHTWFTKVEGHWIYVVLATKQDSLKLVAFVQYLV